METIPGAAELIKSYGLPGIVVAIALYLLLQYKGENQKVWEGRREDWKSMEEALRVNATTMAAQASASEARTRASEAQAKSIELAALAQTQLVNEMQRLGAAHASLATEVKALRDDALRRGGGA